jgi:SSS family solute:Na+ symporter
MVYLIILVSFAVLMIGYGAWVSRTVSDASGFFVAGRNLNAALIFSTFLAANIGGGATIGAAGLGYRDGMSAWWWVGSAGIGSAILAFSVGPRIWRVAAQHNLYTVGDYLEFRYNRSLRGLFGVFFWLGSLAILAGQLIAIAWMLNVIAGIDKAVGCLIGAAITTTYFTLGGLQGAARVNALQLIIKLVGFAAAFGWLLWFYSAPEKISADSLSSNYFSLMGTGANGVWQMMVLLIPSFVISPGLLQKVFGARNEKAVRLGVGLNAVGLVAFAIVPVMMGIIARKHFPGLENHELAIPKLMTEAMPTWIGGLLLSAIFAAEVSAVDAVLFMLSTSLSRDFYQAFIRRDVDDEQLVQVARESAVICGALGAVLAILLPDVSSALRIFYTVLVAALLLPLLTGLYSSRVSSRTAILTMIVSVAVTLSVSWMPVWQSVPPIALGTLCGAVAMLTGTLLERTTHTSSDSLNSPGIQ